MVQNQADRRLCVHCQRNVFPTRSKPNILAIIISAIFVIPLIIYLIYYAGQEIDKCPICYQRVRAIDYNYPPFRGTLESYDPSLINVGAVIRTEESFLDPEGSYVQTIPTQYDKNDNLDLNTENKKTDDSDENNKNGNKGFHPRFCMLCGSELPEFGKFCAACGHELK